MKTFLRRPGNKSKHLKHILPLIPKNYGTYIEPFAGTGALFLELEPKKWIINDLNKDVISIWNLIKTDPEYLLSEIQRFSKTFLPLNNEKKLKLCKEIVSQMDQYKPKKRAVMYLLMIYCSFNGCVILKNKWYISGLNFSLYKSGNCHIFTDKYKQKIIQLNSLLRTGQILNQDYTQVLKKAKKGDFVFLDPPYIEEKTYAFSYNKDEIFDLKSLSVQLKTLDKLGVEWLMTQVDTENVREYFGKYNIKTYINNQSFSTEKRNKRELIITNYTC